MFLKNFHEVYSYRNSNSFDSGDLDQSILNHLFLPYDLPSSADDDHLIKSNHQNESNHENEYKLLELVNQFFESLDAKKTLPIFPILKNCIHRWSILQNPNGCSALNLQSTIEKLGPGDFLPIYFHAQNAAILIEIDENPPNEALISAWQVALPTETITSSLEPHLSCFPVPTFRLSDRSQLRSQIQCELLVDFMNNTIEYTKVNKSSNTFNEPREVPVAHYVCQWWITQFHDIEQVKPSAEFKKKHRDQIRWKSSNLPFRRSGLWMAIKVVFQTILTKRLGPISAIVYKLLITYFLTYVIHQRQVSAGSRLSTDILIQCLRKIARRLNKIESLLSSIDSNDISEWIEHITNDIKQKIQRISPKLDWQEEIEKKQSFSKFRFDPYSLDIYQHSCTKLKSHLTRHQHSSKAYKQSSNLYDYYSWNTMKVIHDDENDPLPSVTSLARSSNDTIGTDLTRIEIWIQSNLKAWINRSKNVDKRFEALQSFYEHYQRVALKYYYSDNKPSDPIGYSRFLLTSLTIIHLMHQKLCADQQFERLKLHAIQIPHLIDLFEFFVLPYRDEMIRARDLYDYFREFSEKPYPDLLSSIESKNAFGVNFADRSEEMNETLRQIEAQVEKDKNDKINEVQNEKKRYEQLMEKAKNLKCECDADFPYRKCEQCKTYKEAKNIEVSIYECPIPDERKSALAVIFELQMPNEFRSYRDILWQFINRPNPQPSHSMDEWLNTSPHSTKLRPFDKGFHQCKVKLVSSTKSITQRHYSGPQPVATTPLEDYLRENGLQVQISPTKPTTFQDECRTLTPQLTDPNYKDLQFALDNTLFMQNRVIADLSKCSLLLKPIQFIEFGSFRSGHCLQWWNLLSMFDFDSLSMDDESVAILIHHALLQNGPMTVNPKTLIYSWCPEAHQQLLEDHFVDELIVRLYRCLKDCESNWQNELILVIITVIVMRISTICNITRKDRTRKLILKCRSMAEKWIELILESIQNSLVVDCEKLDALRNKIVIIGTACLLTFSMYTEQSDGMELSNQDIVTLLKITTNIHDNLVLSKKQTNTTVFMRNLMRWTERILVLMHPVVNEHLEKTSYASLNEFAAIYWAVVRSKGITDGKWKKREKDIYDGWYDGQYQSIPVSIDLLRGTFLVNKTTIGFLPSTITSDKLFRRVFGNHIFEVHAAESENTYITKFGYHGHRKVHYEFHYDWSTWGFTIHERHIQTNDQYQLIPPDCFEEELPDIFVSNYSHWINETKDQIEFRPIHFQDSNFLTDKQYILTINKGYITTNDLENMQILINRSSTFFRSLFTRYFIRLDEEPYVYMLRHDALIHIHLVRLGIAFKYDIHQKIITSREYSDMYVDENQWFGTLTGLKSGLLLSPLAAIDQNHLCRKLIVPFGQVQVIKTSDSNHQTVTIERKSSILHQYFVFILNDRLRVLQSIDSPTGWLYLALLHAMTSHALPDYYTGMTGMERSFQLLNSAGCWSDQPFDSVSLDILFQLANISPKVDFYPQHRSCMSKVEWNSSNLPYSLQHFGYYLIVKKLVEASEQWNFMHLSTTSGELQKLFESKKYNEQLLGKLYWDYRDSYNPIARLSPQMEAEIRSARTTKLYQPILESYSLETNYNSMSLVNNLYSSGSVDLKDSSTLHCFPCLSRWLTSEYQLKNIWIGLFKVIEKDKRPDEIDRFELLLSFLHYISNKCSIQPFYLQLLRSILKSSITTLRSLSYPSFIHYENIDEVSFQYSRIQFPRKLWRRNHPAALQEVRDCFNQTRTYTNEKFPEININEYKINELFQSWRSNGKLRSFLEDIQNHIRSVVLVPLKSRVSVRAQQFAVETFQQHYQIQLHLQDHDHIDPQLLENAQQKFLYPHADYFIKPTVCTPITNEQREFPERIFPSTDSQSNPLSEIANHFKNHLSNSWKQFQVTEEYSKKYPSIDQINQYLHYFRQQSEQLWNELVRSMTMKHELLFATGLMLRILPTTLISVFQQIWLNEKYDNWSPLFLTFEQRTLLGGLMVNWVVEQQTERALHLASQGKSEDFEKEISNVPHVNWTPSEHLPWLILELEMNITIREIQVEVAQHMIQPKTTQNNSTIRNVVMQMNMGEGKTSVILPMLALSLASPSANLVRIIVLKSLFPMNYQSLRYKLGGLLNRRVLPFACRRDMNFSDNQANQIFTRLQRGLNNRDVVLTSPEDILSFDLLTIDKCRRKEFDVSRSMLSTQRWLKTFVRDILDESDEILHVKYQLIYSIGRQQQVDGGIERWKTVQMVLNFVKQHAASIAEKYSDDVFYKTSERQSSFSEFRFLTHRPFAELCQRIAHDWLNQKNYHPIDHQSILSFILDVNVSIDSLPNHFKHDTIQLCLILRGLLSSEVLFVALKKRYRVNYGVNYDSPKFKRLMAVPFRAKDVAADNTEFGHPDVAIVLTQLSYYYRGLNDEQMLRCFNRLNQDENDREMIYDQWISLETNTETIAGIKQWKKINLKDSQQRTTLLFPTLRYNMSIIDYFLDHFVFPHEAKQFPHKLVSSAWDLSSSARENIITGFSGTNDTQLLLPVHIRQCDLPELQKTDAIVLNNLLRSENENYQCLPLSASSDQILTQIVNEKSIIQVIIDVGALFVDGTNQQIAEKWLNLSDKTMIDYAVYFDSDSISVSDRQDQRHAFLTSPASERLDRCVFYLDEIHTRGTDFKFPNQFRAAVTLGNNLTKDRLVQACMRMRKLGKHHWLSFWSSNEVHQQIQLLKEHSDRVDEHDNTNDRITLTDILRWVYENTQHATWDGLHHWAAQSLSFQRKVTAFRTIHSMDPQESFTDVMMEILAGECLEAEVLELKSMYGPSKIFQTISEIYDARHEHSSICSSDEIHQAVSRQLENFSGRKKLLTQLLDEEQQRELEREQEQEEERQQKRPLPAHPCEPVLHVEIKSLCDLQGSMMNLSKFSSVFCPVSEAFLGTSLYRDCQPGCWQENLWISNEFKRVIETRGELLDSFLRPTRWIVVYRNKHLIFVSAYEANWLMGQLHFLYRKQTMNEPSTTTLRLLLPRTKRDQSISINTTALTMPPSIDSSSGAVAFTIRIRWLVELFVFNGSLYFESNDEQTAYCQCLGLCQKPRTAAEEEAFKKGWIAEDGYVDKLEHRSSLQLDQCRFRSNPLGFVRKLVEIRNHMHAPSTSHVGSIISNAFKLPIS